VDDLRHYQDGKGELLRQLEIYPGEDVDDVLARVSTGIGEHNAPSFDAELHALTVTRDVMHGRQRDELTQEMGSRLATAAGLLWLLDEDEVVVAVSSDAAALYGYEPDELVGRSTRHLQADGQDWQALRAEYEANDGYGEGVALVKHKDGSPVAVSYRARAVALAGRRLILCSVEPLARPLTYRELRGTGVTYADLEAGRLTRRAGEPAGGGGAAGPDDPAAGIIYEPVAA
jgi:PAS domain S-box-containing protein